MFHIRLFKAGHVARVMDINLHAFQFKYLTHLITLTLNNKNKITFYLHKVMLYTKTIPVISPLPMQTFFFHFKSQSS